MPWKCPSCSEGHDDQFDSCWKCGTTREGKKPAVSPRSELEEPADILDPPSIPCATTPSLPGRTVARTHGIVCGEAIMGANFVRDLFAGITDFIGGRSGEYESKLRQGRSIALDEMASDAIRLGADAVVGVQLDYETVGESMFMVIATGTAVSLESELIEPGGDVDVPE